MKLRLEPSASQGVLPVPLPLPLPLQGALERQQGCPADSGSRPVCLLDSQPAVRPAVLHGEAVRHVLVKAVNCVVCSGVVQS